TPITATKISRNPMCDLRLKRCRNVLAWMASAVHFSVVAKCSGQDMNASARNESRQTQRQGHSPFVEQIPIVAVEMYRGGVLVPQELNICLSQTSAVTARSGQVQLSPYSIGSSAEIAKSQHKLRPLPK